MAGAGLSGVGLSFNRWAYRVRRHVLIRTLRNAGVKPRGAKILELGFDRGGAGWRFKACDIGAPLPLNAAHGACDIATAFEVLFHLIEEKSWEGALDNLTRGDQARRTCADLR